MPGFNIKKLIRLSKYTTLRVGGPAEWLGEPENINELKGMLSWAISKNLNVQIIGAGSNLLISDFGLEGLSLCMRKFQGSRFDQTTGIIEAFGGEPIPSLARRAAKKGLKGLEWAVGIPGTVGGAAVMNAGAQGGCIADRLESVKVLPINGEDPFEIKKKDLAFAYRHSQLQEEQLIVISARFKLEPGHDKQELSHITSQNLNHRTHTQPYHLPSCGSVFRNPEPLKAGRLIESVGLKGFRIGDAEISKIHANFIVNQGNAYAKEINDLILLVQQKVEKAHGLILHPEIMQLGFEEKD